METASKKEIFKLLIQEFLESPAPDVIRRDLNMPVDAEKVVTIYGPRRSGKSFYFYEMMQALVQKGISRERIIYINFEDDRILPINSKELGAFIEAYYEFFPENKERTVFFFFDEIQNIGGWELFIRRIFDKERVKIFLTGSSSKLLSREIATSLRGRTLSFALYPLQFKDFLKFKGQELKKNFEYTSQRYKVKKLVDEYMEFGAFPEIVLSQNATIKKRMLKEYFDL